MTNAVNLIDGLDGLAAGIVAIAGGALFLFADRLFKAGYLDGDNIAPLVASSPSACASASCRSTGTRRRSSWATRARCSSASCSRCPTITIGGRTDFAFSGNTYFFFAPLAIPVVILGVPILDVGVLVRAAARETPALAPGRRRPPPSPPDAARPRPAPRPSSCSVAWTALLSGVALVPTYHEGGQRDRALRGRGARPGCCSPCSTPACGAPGAAGTVGPSGGPRPRRARAH